MDKKARVQLKRTPPQKSAATAEEMPFILDAWLPYAFAFISGRVSVLLANYYRKQFGISVPGWRVMVRVGLDGPLSAKEVGERATMDAVQVTRAVNELAKLSFVSRRTDPADRRRIVLKLTAKGRQAYEAITPVAAQLEERLQQSLSEEERRVLRKATMRLLEDVRGPDWDPANKIAAETKPARSAKKKS